MFYKWQGKTLVLDPGYFAYYSPVPSWVNQRATLDRPFGTDEFDDTEDVEYLPQVIEEPAVDIVPVIENTASDLRANIQARPITYVALSFLAGVIAARMLGRG